MVVFACLANFLSDSVATSAPSVDQVRFNLTETITRHLNLVKTYALDNPSKLVAVVQPLIRQTPIWYFSHYALVLQLFNDLFGQSRTPNMYKFTALEPKLLQFDGDLVHLVPSSGLNYVYNLFEQAFNVFDLSHNVVSRPGDDSDDSETFGSTFGANSPSYSPILRRFLRIQFKLFISDGLSVLLIVVRTVELRFLSQTVLLYQHESGLIL